jgi:hypothetical protein
MKKSVFILAALLIGLTTACSKSSSAQANSALQFSFEIYGNSYTITGYYIEKDEDGNTQLSIIGSGYDKMAIRNGGLLFPMWGSFEANGKEIEPKSGTMKSESLTFNFNSMETPEKIIIRHGETDEIIFSFNVADVEQTIKEE